MSADDVVLAAFVLTGDLDVDVLLKRKTGVGEARARLAERQDCESASRAAQPSARTLEKIPTRSHHPVGVTGAAGGDGKVQARFSVIRRGREQLSSGRPASSSMPSSSACWLSA